MTEKIALGTAQFGLHYGVANTRGQVHSLEVEKILHWASSQGIKTIDTAIAYGNSEEILGKAGVTEWQIVSKIPSCLEIEGSIEEWMNLQVDSSLSRLGCKKLYGLLLHNSSDLISKKGDKVFPALTSLQKAGKVKKIGVSIYDAGELDEITKQYKIDLVQAPFNVFDRRLMSSGWLKKMAEKNIEIHTRSAFLQGLLLMSRESIPEKFSTWNRLWDHWHAYLKKASLTPLQACLGFLTGISEISRIVVGVDNLLQLRQIVAAGGHRIAIPERISTTDLKLINPANWVNL